MKQNLRKLINYSIKKESKHLVLTLDELKEIQSADKRLRKLEKEVKQYEKVIEIFKGFSLGLTMYGGSETSYGLEANNSIILTKEQYELLREVLEND